MLKTSKTVRGSGWEGIPYLPNNPWILVGCWVGVDYLSSEIMDGTSHYTRNHQCEWGGSWLHVRTWRHLCPGRKPYDISHCTKSRRSLPHCNNVCGQLKIFPLTHYTREGGWVVISHGGGTENKSTTVFPNINHWQCRDGWRYSIIFFSLTSAGEPRMVGVLLSPLPAPECNWVYYGARYLPVHTSASWNYLLTWNPYVSVEHKLYSLWKIRRTPSSTG